MSMAETTHTASDDFSAQRLSKRAIAVRPGVGNQLIEMARARPDVIALGRGDPDLPTPPHIVEAAKRAMDAGHTHYTPLRGLDSLRNAIATKLEAENGVKVDPDEQVLITTGTQEAIFVVALALLDQGDEMLTPDPYYFSYEYAVRYAGGEVVSVPTSANAAFQPDVDEIARRITPRTKALALLTPHNPTGAVYTRATLERIAGVALSRNLLIVSDELYEKLVFEGSEHFSIGSLPGMHERTITINGFSKNYRMTGWRIGYLAGPASFVRVARQIQRTITICAPSISQHAAVAALTGPQECLAESLSVYSNRRSAALRELDKLGVRYFQPAGTFYVFADISASGMSSSEFCLELLRQANVFVYPGAQFGVHGEGFVRISLLAPIPTLLEGMNRVGHFLLDPTGKRA